MADDTLFRLIAAERLRLADLLDGLSPDQWEAPSLCAGWTVRDVAAHLAVPLGLSRRQVAGLMLRYRFNFDRLTQGEVRRDRRSPAELAAALRAGAEDRFAPPVVGPAAPLTDVVVHSQDIARPLGIDHPVAPDRALAVLDFLAGPKAALGFVPRGRLAGLSLDASDLGWTFGQGAMVRGPAVPLMLAMAGRAAALPELDGAGVDVLAGRLRAG